MKEGGYAKEKSTAANDKGMSPKDLGVRFCESGFGSPEEAGLGSSGPNQVPKGPKYMHGNRKGTGSNKI